MNQDNFQVKKHILKSASLVSFMTLCSRILGMVRDILSANLFGIGKVWDGFVFAFMIPNFLRRLLGEGALTGAFIPLYTEMSKDYGEKEANYFTNLILSLMLVGFGGVLILMNLGIALVLHFFQLPEKVALILGLSQLFLPYILLLCLISVVIGVLNCHKKFFVPSLQPIILNIVWIFAITILCYRLGRTLEEKVYILAGAILFAGILQFLLQFTLLHKSGFRYRFCLDLKYPFLSKLFYLMLPAALSFSVTQINILVDLCLAYVMGDGATSALWYGNRLMQFPLGLFGIAIGTVLLPTISKQAANNEIDNVKESLSFSMRTVLLIIIPSTIGLIVLSQPIISLLFEGGLFNQEATIRTSRTLIAYSLGLFAYSGIRLLLPCFYSLQDTVTPVFIGVMCMATNIVLNLILMQFFQEAGLALATSITNTFNFLLLFMLLEKKIGVVSGMFEPLLKITLASLLMGAVVLVFYRFVEISFFSGEKLNSAIRIFAAISVGLVFYLIGCFVFRVRECKMAIELVTNKLKKKS